MKRKILLFFTILILILGFNQVLAKSFSTADFEVLAKKLGYENFGNLDDYSSSNNYTLNNIKTMISSDYSKFFVRIFNSDGTLNTNEFYVCMHSNINVKFKFFYNSSKNIYTYDILNHSNNNEFASFARFNISDKTFLYTNENYVTNFFMNYENFSNMSLDTFKSEEFQRLMMKSVIAYADGDILSPGNDLLNARLSCAVNSTLYNDVEYVGSISYDSFFNRFKFVFTSGFDLSQDYGFYIERFEIKDDDTIEAKGINRLNSHNSHSPAEKGFYGFNGQHGTDIFPFQEELELDLAGVDTSQRYVYRVCIGAISESDGLLSTTPFIASDLLLFNENTLYTYPYFKFDYTYVPILKIEYDKNYTDDDPSGGNDGEKDYTGIIEGIGDKITNKLEETKTGILNGIWDLFKRALDYLFQPSEEQIMNLVNDVTSNDVVSDSVLGIPLILMSRFLNLFVNREYTDFKVEWDDWNLKLIGSDDSISIVKAGSYNISKLVRDDATLTKIYNYYILFVSVAASLGFIWWAVGFFKDILSLSDVMPGANNKTDKALDGSSPTDDEVVESARRFYYDNYGNKPDSAAKDFYRSRIKKMERGVYFGNRKRKGRK